jgi:ABC-type phosphate transport system permease subunit
VQTRMHPLIYAAPISKADYLGGRFLAAFVLNAVILLAVPLGILAAVYLPGRGPGWLVRFARPYT